MARGLHALLPPIEVVNGSFCNTDPDNPREWEAGLAAKLGAKADDPPRRVRDAPFVQIPLGVTEDRLVGTVDIEASMRVGRLRPLAAAPRPCCQPVLMPAALPAAGGQDGLPAGPAGGGAPRHPVR